MRLLLCVFFLIPFALAYECFDKENNCVHSSGKLCKGNGVWSMSGKTCLIWSETKAPYKDYPHNFCTTTPDYDVPWCYIKSWLSLVPWDFGYKYEWEECFPRCDDATTTEESSSEETTTLLSEKQTCVDETKDCAWYGSEACLLLLSTEKTVDVNGNLCDDWSGSYNLTGNNCANPLGSGPICKGTNPLVVKTGLYQKYPRCYKDCNATKDVEQNETDGQTTTEETTTTEPSTNNETTKKPTTTKEITTEPTTTEETTTKTITATEPTTTTETTNKTTTTKPTTTKPETTTTPNPKKSVYRPCVNEELNCVWYGEGCKNFKGSTKKQTGSNGEACADWDGRQELTNSSSFCANPDGDPGGPWCFTEPFVEGAGDMSYVNCYVPCA